MGMLVSGVKRMADEVRSTSGRCIYIETKIKISVTLATSYTEHENLFLLFSLN